MMFFCFEWKIMMFLQCQIIISWFFYQFDREVSFTSLCFCFLLFFFPLIVIVTTSILTFDFLCVCLCACAPLCFSSSVQHAEMADESVQLKTLQTILIIFQSHLHPESEVSNIQYHVGFQFSMCNAKVGIVVMMQIWILEPSYGDLNSWTALILFDAFFFFLKMPTWCKLLPPNSQTVYQIIKSTLERKKVEGKNSRKEGAWCRNMGPLTRINGEERIWTNNDIDC